VLQGLLYSRQNSGRAEAWRGVKKVKRKLRSYQKQKTTRNMYMLRPIAARRLPLPARMTSSRRFGFPALEHLRCVSLCVVLPFLAEAICGPIIC